MKLTCLGRWEVTFLILSNQKRFHMGEERKGICTIQPYNEGKKRFIVLLEGFRKSRLKRSNLLRYLIS